jgi:hypothetical protein
MMKPSTLAQRSDLCFIYIATGFVVDISERGFLPEFSLPCQSFNPSLLTLREFMGKQ